MHIKKHFDKLMEFVQDVIDNPDQDLDQDELEVLVALTPVFDKLDKLPHVLSRLYSEQPKSIKQIADDIQRLRSRIAAQNELLRPIRSAVKQVDIDATTYEQAVINGGKLYNWMHDPRFWPLVSLDLSVFFNTLDKTRE